MRQHLALLFTFIMAINYFGLNQATTYKQYNAEEDHKLPASATVTHYNRLKNAVIKSKENVNYLQNKLMFHNVSNNLPIQENQKSYRLHNKKQYFYSPLNYTIVDTNNVDVVYKKRNDQLFDPLNNSQQRRPLHLKQLQSQNQELSSTYAGLIYDTNQLEIAPKETTVSSSDHHKTRFLAGYVTPSPSYLEMHPNLHHIKSHINLKKPLIVSHASSNQPSPMTTTLINMQQFPSTFNDVKYIVDRKSNELNNGPDILSEYKKPQSKTGSKQYIYAPMRSTSERELSYSSNTLPYPPSFISITTTEKFLVNYEATQHKIPDLFTHRQSKSLLDSYIPSWQIAKMLEQMKYKADFKYNNNLHTLAFPRQHKN